MKYNGACKSLHKRSYLTIIMVHARSMLLYQDSIKNTEASNHHILNIGRAFFPHGFVNGYVIDKCVVKCGLNLLIDFQRSYQIIDFFKFMSFSHRA